jgi:cobalt-zinc-cadmium efflux system membrane fusion protein
MKVIAVLCTLFAASAFAAPGAHGPGGEHLDGQPHAPAGAAVPRVEAASEAFELVGRLMAGELSILVDRFETNEPVLDAQVEVRLGTLKAAAKFRANHGDFSVDDAAFLKALQKPGEHALIFAIVAGSDSDLLEGKLVVTEDAAAGAGHSHLFERLILVGILMAIVIAFLYVLRRRKPARSAAALLIAATLAAPVDSGAHGPTGAQNTASSGASSSAPSRLPDGSIHLPKPAQRRLEIRTVAAAVTDAAATLELPGRVVMNPNAGGRVQSAHGGRVEAAGGLLPVAGQKVAKGQTLAYVQHHADPYARANQQAQLSELHASRLVAEQKVKRLESLEGTVPRKEIDAARVELRSLVEREQRVSSSIGSREALVAPVAGVVASTHAIAGQIVEAREVLFEIVDPTKLLVEAVLSDVAVADAIAGAQIQGVPGIALHVVGIGRSLRDGVLPITFRMESSAPLPLAVGQPVAVVATLKERVKGIVLPARALVRSPANEPVVWIKAGAERYLSQPVRFRMLDAERIVVTGGLSAENRVVVGGASLLAQIR